MFKCVVWGVSVLNSGVEWGGALTYDAASSIRGLAIGFVGFGVAW